MSREAVLYGSEQISDRLGHSHVKGSAVRTADLRAGDEEIQNDLLAAFHRLALVLSAARNGVAEF